MSVYDWASSVGESGAYQEATRLLMPSIAANASPRANLYGMDARCLNRVDEKVGLMLTLLTEASMSDP